MHTRHHANSCSMLTSTKLLFLKAVSIDDRDGLPETNDEKDKC